MPRSVPTYREQWPITAQAIQRFGTDGIKPERRGEMERYARFAITNKDKYIAVEQATRVPWPLVAVIHRRESDSDFDTYLGNGQALNRRTTIVPEGRGPFCNSLPAPLEAFVRGGVDAFAIDGLSAVQQAQDRWILGSEWGSWPIEKMLYYAEKLNGWGYYLRGLRSPYVWGGTIMQQAGKYVSDNVFDGSVWDKQPGCAPILWMIGYLDPNVHFTRET